MTAVFN